MTPLWLACLLAACAARAQQEVEGVAVRDHDSQAVAEMKSSLQSDPSAADALARRVLKSSLAEMITRSQDPEERFRAVRAWIDRDPGGAALVGVGLFKDDAAGSHFNEEKLAYRENRVMVENEGTKKGVFGRLKKASGDSLAIDKEEKMLDEERRETLKSLFEGMGGMSKDILTGQASGPGAGQDGAAAPAGEGFYDRLGQGNLTGYSPQVMAIQSALNGRRAPGAPKLIETGKLDYPTLRHPIYGMRYDLENLEKRLRYQSSLALARLLGLERRYTAEELLSPELLRELERKAAGKNLSPRLQRRRRVLDRVAAALADFEQAAEPSRDPGKITKRLLAALGDKQKEAARWITIASLEEELGQIEQEENFFSAELLAAIDHAPMPPAREAYKRRGQIFKARLGELKVNDLAAIKDLESAAWAKRLAAVQERLDQNARLRRNLSRDIRNFERTPFHLLELGRAKPRWRLWLDRLILRFLPSSSYGRELSRQGRDAGLLKDAFGKIATGDLDAADSVLASYAPPVRR